MGSLSMLASSYNGQGLLIKMNRRAGGIFVYTCTSTGKRVVANNSTNWPGAPGPEK